MAFLSASWYAGHKKDVVITNRLTREQGRIAIYGWHQPTGIPIQPLSTVHGAGYADYSHGIRLVSDVVLIDGKHALSLRRSAGSRAGCRIHRRRSRYAQLRPNSGDTCLVCKAAGGCLPIILCRHRQVRNTYHETPFQSSFTSCSTGNPDGSCGGCRETSPGCRARTEHASGTSPRGPGRCRI